MKKFALFVSTGLLLVFFVGCATIAVNARLKEIDQLMNPLVGRSKRDIINRLGAPTEIQKIDGSMEVYIYYRSFGSRSTASATGYRRTAYAQGRQWEMYDLIRAYFENDVMYKWDSYVQR